MCVNVIPLPSPSAEGLSSGGGRARDSAQSRNSFQRNHPLTRQSGCHPNTHAAAPNLSTPTEAGVTTRRSPSAHATPCQSAPTHLPSRHGADAQPGAEQASGSRNGVAFSRYHLKTAEHGGSDVRKPARGEAPGPACPRPPQVSRQTGGNDRGGPGSRSKVRGHAARARGSESRTRRGRKLDGTSLVLVPHLPRHGRCSQEDVAYCRSPS